MAQVFISNEHDHSLETLAQDRGMSPDQLLTAMIAQLEREDQVAFWGEDVIETLRQQLVTRSDNPCSVSEADFFAELAAIPYTS